MIPVVYVAGPYSAATVKGIHRNIRNALELGADAARKGWAPVIPHVLGSQVDEVAPGLGEPYWYAATLEMLRRCDAVVLCPGWCNSKGTVAEIAEAYKQRIPVFQSESELPLSQDFLQDLCAGHVAASL